MFATPQAQEFSGIVWPVRLTIAKPPTSLSIIASGGTVVVVGVVAGVATAIWTIFAGEPPEWMAFTALTEYKKENLKEYGCEYLEISQS